MTRMAALALILPLLAAGCAGIQGRDHAYVICVVSEPRYEPKQSTMQAVLAPLTDLTGLPKGLVLGSVATEAVRAAGNAKLKVSRMSFPVNRDQGYLLAATDQGFTLQSLPLAELRARAGGVTVPKLEEVPRAP